MFAAVGCLEDAASGTPRHELPRRSPGLPESGIQGFRILRVHHQIRDARRIISVKNLSPRFSAVRRLEDAALRIRTEYVAECCDVADVWICRVNADARDLARVSESQRGPGLSRVVGTPYAVAVRNISADVGLTRTDIDDVRVRFAHTDRADRAAEILVRDR